jgi:hypothetical protein
MASARWIVLTVLAGHKLHSIVQNNLHLCGTPKRMLLLTSTDLGDLDREHDELGRNGLVKFFQLDTSVPKSAHLLVDFDQPQTALFDFVIVDIESLFFAHGFLNGKARKSGYSFCLPLITGCFTARVYMATSVEESKTTHVRTYDFACQHNSIWHHPRMPEIRFDKNNVPTFTADARCSIVEIELEEYEKKNGKLSDEQRRIFLEAGAASVSRSQTYLSHVLQNGCDLVNGDGAIRSALDVSRARNERFKIGDRLALPLLVGKVATSDSIVIG